MIKIKSKNFIFFLILLGIIICFNNNAVKAYGDEKSIDYSRYYYMQLSDEAKFIYDALYDNIENTKSGNYIIEKEISKELFNSLKTDGTTIVQSAMDAFDRDHPEVFWLDITKIQIKFKSSKIMFIPVATNTGESYLIDEYAGKESPLTSVVNDLEAMENIITDIYQKTSKMDSYAKIKYIHDYLVYNNDYNSDSYNANSFAYKSISAIIGNVGSPSAPVCEGYSRAFKVICDRLSIPCVIVSGEGLVNNEDIGHMWNYVNVDGKWYGIDVTWDDPVIVSGTYEDLSEELKYEYFLFGKEKENLTHIPSKIFTNLSVYFKEFTYPDIYPLNYGDKTKLYSITLTKYSNGIISTDVNNAYVKPGTLVNISIDVKDGMKLIEGSVKVNGEVINELSFIMPEKDVVITAAFMTDIPQDDSDEDNEHEDNEENTGDTTQDNSNENDNDNIEDNKEEEDNKIDNDTNDENIDNDEDNEKGEESKDNIEDKKEQEDNSDNLDKETSNDNDNSNKDDDNNDNIKENNKDKQDDDNESDDKDDKVNKPSSTKKPDKDNVKDEDKAPTKLPSSTKEPGKEEPTEEPQSTIKPTTNISTPETDVPDNKNNSPDQTKEPNKSDNSSLKDDKESTVILVEDNFDVINPLENIVIINKATIAMSNKDVVYNYKPFLNDKKITIYISDSTLRENNIKDIVSQKYLIKENSTIESIQVIVYNTENKTLVEFIDKNTPLTVFVPVDSSWINQEYEEYFYLIKDGEPERKNVMVRESNGQYYLQLTLEDAATNYAIIRRKAGEINIPGTTTTTNYLSSTNTDSSKAPMEIGPKELILIGLALIAVALTIKVVRIQHKYNTKKEENE